MFFTGSVFHMHSIPFLFCAGSRPTSKLNDQFLLHKLCLDQIDAALTIYPVDEFPQGVDLGLDSWLGKRIIILPTRTNALRKYGKPFNI